MKFYSPFEVANRTGSLGLTICIVLAIMLLFVVFATGLLLYPVISLKIIVAVVISRIVYAVIKGD